MVCCSPNGFVWQEVCDVIIVYYSRAYSTALSGVIIRPYASIQNRMSSEIDGIALHGVTGPAAGEPPEYAGHGEMAQRQAEEEGDELFVEPKSSEMQDRRLQ